MQNTKWSPRLGVMQLLHRGPTQGRSLVPVSPFCFAICDTHISTTVQMWPTNRSFPFLLLPNAMNTMSEKMMITLCLVPHIVPSPPHSTYPEVSRLNTSCQPAWAMLGWAVVQIIQFSRSNPSKGLHGARSCDGSRDVLGLCYATELCG